MSNWADVLFLLVFVLGIPVAFSIVLFVLCFRFARQYDIRSIPLVSLIFTVAFYIFRLLYLLLLSIRPLYSGSFIDNFSRNYEDLFRWVDTGDSLFYVLDRRFEIHLPNFLYRNWLGVSIMEVLFYLSLGVVIVIAAKFWKGNLQSKLGALALLLPTFVFYLYVIGHWMYLALHI